MLNPSLRLLTEDSEEMKAESVKGIVDDSLDTVNRRRLLIERRRIRCVKR